VDESDVDEYRLAMAGRSPCNVCSGTTWRGFGNSIDGKPARLVLGAAWPDGTPVEDYGFSVIAAACVTCGNLRFFVADLLALDDESELNPEPHE
jgi:hypothetical protein